MKNIRVFTKYFQFLAVKFSIYLNRHVFVMLRNRSDKWCIVRSNATVNRVLSERKVRFNKRTSIYCSTVVGIFKSLV